MAGIKEHIDEWGNALMRTATLTCSPRADGVLDAMLGAIARCLCSVFGGHEDIRKVEPQAKRIYLQCMRCLRTTRGFALESTPQIATTGGPDVIEASWLAQWA